MSTTPEQLFAVIQVWVVRAEEVSKNAWRSSKPGEEMARAEVFAQCALELSKAIPGFFPDDFPANAAAASAAAVPAGPGAATPAPGSTSTTTQEG